MHFNAKKLLVHYCHNTREKELGGKCQENKRGFIIKQEQVKKQDYVMSQNGETNFGMGTGNRRTGINDWTGDPILHIWD